jgi:hypothetical protein
MRPGPACWRHDRRILRPARLGLAFADELFGVPHIDMDDVPGDPRRAASPATRLVQARKTAAARAQRDRDKARRAHELDAAIVAGGRSIMRSRKIYERLRDGEALPGMAVRVEPIFGEAMSALVTDYG